MNQSSYYCIQGGTMNRNSWTSWVKKCHSLTKVRQMLNRFSYFVFTPWGSTVNLWISTSVPSNLANGSIAVLSTLAVANGFVRSWPHLIHGSLDPHESAPQTHLDRFSCFWVVQPCAQHTDTQTTLRATSLATGRILCTACKRCGLVIK